MPLILRNDIPMKVHFGFAIIAPTLLPFKSEITEGTVSYNLQRVSIQIEYDQGATMITMRREIQTF